MAYTQKDNTGSLFKNDEKREGRKDPDYNGSVVVDGKSYWLSCWVKNKASDPDYKPDKKTFMSLSLTPKDQPAQSAAPRQASRPAPRPPSSTPPPASPPRPPDDPDLSLGDTDVPF